MKQLAKFLTLVLVILILSACVSGQSLKNRAGVWEGDTDFGEFTFKVSQDGKTVTNMDFTNKSTGIATSIISLDGTKIGRDNTFQKEIPGDSLFFQCKFNDDGTSASIHWEWGNEIEDFVVEK